MSDRPGIGWNTFQLELKSSFFQAAMQLGDPKFELQDYVEIIGYHPTWFDDIVPDADKLGWKYQGPDSMRGHWYDTKPHLRGRKGIVEQRHAGDGWYVYSVRTAVHEVEWYDEDQLKGVFTKLEVDEDEDNI